MMKTKMQLLRTNEEAVKAYMQYDSRGGGYQKQLNFKDLLKEFERSGKFFLDNSVDFLLNNKRKTFRLILVKTNKEDNRGFLLVFSKVPGKYYRNINLKTLEFAGEISEYSFVEFDEIDFSDRGYFKWQIQKCNY